MNGQLYKRMVQVILYRFFFGVDHIASWYSSCQLFRRWQAYFTFYGIKHFSLKLLNVLAWWTTGRVLFCFHRHWTPVNRVEIDAVHTFLHKLIFEIQDIAFCPIDNQKWWRLIFSWKWDFVQYREQYSAFDSIPLWFLFPMKGSFYQFVWIRSKVICLHISLICIVSFDRWVRFIFGRFVRRQSWGRNSF